MLRPCLLSLFAAAGLGLCGCETFLGARPDGILRPSGFDALTLPDENDPTEDEVDEWSFVGNEARGNQMLERDPDPWWKRWVMSEKANAIERNLGIAGPDDI